MASFAKERSLGRLQALGMKEGRVSGLYFVGGLVISGFDACIEEDYFGEAVIMAYG